MYAPLVNLAHVPQRELLVIRPEDLASHRRRVSRLPVGRIDNDLDELLVNLGRQLLDRRLRADEEFFDVGFDGYVGAESGEGRSELSILQRRE